MFALELASGQEAHNIQDSEVAIGCLVAKSGCQKASVGAPRWLVSKLGYSIAGVVGDVPLACEVQELHEIDSQNARVQNENQ